MSTPFIPTWSRVKSAIPDFLTRLKKAAEEDKKTTLKCYQIQKKSLKGKI